MIARMHHTVAPSRTSSVARWISIGAIVLLGSACGSSDLVSPTAAVPTAVIARSAVGTGSADCVPNARLIGRVSLSTADAPGTWWRLTREGLDAAGLTDYKAAIEGFFGRPFTSQAEAVSFLVAQVVARDINENGYVCAYSLRGVRTSLGDPEYALTLFGVRDDKHAGSP